MRPRTALTKLGPLLIAPSFTTAEARARGVSAATLAHYVKQGEIKRIAWGVYQSRNAPATTDFRWEGLAEAVQKVKGGVICLISALAVYDLTDEMPREYWIAIWHDTARKVSGRIRLVRMRNVELGKTEIDVGGIKLPIFDRERTVVDSFRYLSIEIAIKALRAGLKKKGSDRLDMKKLYNYMRELRAKKLEHYILAETT